MIFHDHEIIICEESKSRLSITFFFIHHTNKFHPWKYLVTCLALLVSKENNFHHPRSSLWAISKNSWPMIQWFTAKENLLILNEAHDENPNFFFNSLSPSLINNGYKRFFFSFDTTHQMMTHYPHLSSLPYLIIIRYPSIWHPTQPRIQPGTRRQADCLWEKIHVKEASFRAWRECRRSVGGALFFFLSFARIRFIKLLFTFMLPTADFTSFVFFVRGWFDLIFMGWWSLRLFFFCLVVAFIGWRTAKKWNGVMKRNKWK